MNKNYIVVLSIVFLLGIFTTFMLLTEKKYDVEVETVMDYKAKKDLVFFSSWAGYDTKAEVTESILMKFQGEHESINVVNKSSSGNDFLFTLKADFASGKDPHVFGLWPGSDIQLLIDKGKVHPLDEVFEEDTEWKESLGDLGWDWVTSDNHIYGVPFEVIYEGLFINNDIFDELSLEIPKTYEQLKEVIPVIRENGYIPIAYNSTPEGSFIYQNMVISLGGKDEVTEPFDSMGHMKKSFLQAMISMKELYDLGAFPESYLALSDNERNQMFVEKKAAMIVQGSWFVGKDAVEPRRRDVRVIPFPHYENSKAGKKAITYGFGNGVFYISEKAWQDEEIREMSIALIKELTSVNSALKLINENGTQINKKIPEELVNAPAMYYEGRKLVETATDHIGPVDSFIDRTIWEEVLVAEFPSMLNGIITPEQLIEKVEKAYQALK